MSWNIQEAVNYLSTHAEPKSQKSCAKYVRKAIEAGGLSTAGRPGSAYQYKGYLPTIGFTAIGDIHGKNAQREWSNSKAQVGDISVMEHGKHGHICMWNGSKWISDFPQNNMWPYGGDGTCTIFRYGGKIDGSLTPYNGEIGSNNSGSGGGSGSYTSDTFSKREGGGVENEMLEFACQRKDQKDHKLMETLAFLQKQAFALILEGEGVICTEHPHFKNWYLFEDGFFKGVDGQLDKLRIESHFDRYKVDVNSRVNYRNNDLTISEYAAGMALTNVQISIGDVGVFGDLGDFPADVEATAKDVQMFGNTKWTTARKGAPKFLVIHYTAGGNSKPGAAKSTCQMWVNSPRAASADYVVDDATMFQYNPNPAKIACYAVGKPKNKNLHSMHNCISIEVCSSFDKKKGKNINNANDPGWYFTPQTLGNAVKLAKIIMQKFNIPLSNVIRHYDVSGKLCPGIIGWNPESGSESMWHQFKNMLR